MGVKWKTTAPCASMGKTFFELGQREKFSLARLHFGEPLSEDFPVALW